MGITDYIVRKNPNELFSQPNIKRGLMPHNVQISEVKVAWRPQMGWRPKSWVQRTALPSALTSKPNLRILLATRSFVATMKTHLMSQPRLGNSTAHLYVLFLSMWSERKEIVLFRGCRKLSGIFKVKLLGG